jgi:LCP family protein required for cell wall assembly
MPQNERPPRRPSPFAAAFLSLLFPGLGQAYAGAYLRAIGFAALPLLGTALLAGLLANGATRDALKVSIFDPTMLQALLIADIAILLYRAVAVVDAYHEAVLAGGGTTRLGRPRFRLSLVSLAGLLAVLAVLSMGHVALARYDRIAYDTITAITNEDGEEPEPGAASPAPGTTATPATTPEPGSTETPRPSIIPWDAKERLNILLIGADRRPKQGSFNTDTLIIASIEPRTGQVAMFSVPRDMENIPLPAKFPARNYYAGGVFPAKINSLWMYARGNPNLFPGGDKVRGYAALKGALGELLGIDIRYYLEVDFTGFTKVVDTLGGVTIDVQLPVADYHYPTDDGRGALKLYIPPTIQHMDGAESLAYARSRHQSNDFDRAQRQQRVVTSLRQQTDVLSFLNPDRLEAVSKAVRSAIHTDFPASQLPQLISLMEKVDLANLRSFVFTPPVYAQECAPADCAVKYTLEPKVGAIRQAVREAFTVDPALLKSRLKLATEAGKIWVLNGSGINGQAGAVADYLDYLGVDASVPPVNQGRADASTYKTTTVTFYNGAELKMPETVRVLEDTFGVEVAVVDDPGVTVDVIVITGKKTPKLTLPE